ncbi:hypothetical protein [Pseudoalteromonas rubra]|uniref:hypothetical protein n=1 Tax=Pseudoalteromonas rubra TaxID=43658 RepID=UPI001F0F0674|nr:hypothetical protein [Pseudoalteromonas rubra]
MLKVKKTLSMTALSVLLALGASSALMAQPAEVGSDYYEPEIVGGNPANTATGRFIRKF